MPFMDGSGQLSGCLVPTKFDFAVVTAEGGALRCGTCYDYGSFDFRCGCVSPKRFRLPLRVFELDLRAGELRKNGVKLRLQEQPYQVLLKLIEPSRRNRKPGRITLTLWHEDTFVDFETGLNTAIKRLRETLGDSPIILPSSRLFPDGVTNS